MKKLLVFILVSMSISAGAQYQWDYGLKTGAANYLGDIGGKELPRRDFVWDMHLPQTRYAIGMYGRYKMSKRLSLSLQADHVLLQDADANTTYIPRRTRNLNFRNRMFEVGARAEFTLWYDNDVGNRGYYNPDFKLYVFGGVSAFYSNPQAKLVYDDSLTANPNNVAVGDYVDNTWYNLRELRTEGVRYSAFGVAVPLGIGLYFTFNKEWRVGWEFSWRTTFTDYLDDVSTVYSDVDPESRENQALATDLQSQTYQGLIDEQNLLLTDGQGPMSLNDFGPQLPSTEEKSIRGYSDQNDSYMTTQITVGKVIRGRSKFYKSKYSWVGRRSVHKTKAKF